MVMKTFSVLAKINQSRLEGHLEEIIPFIEQCVKENNNDYMIYSLDVLKYSFKNTESSKHSVTAQM